MEKNKQQVSMTIDTELVKKLDVLAKEQKRSRSYIANQLMNEMVGDE